MTWQVNLVVLCVLSKSFAVVCFIVLLHSYLIVLFTQNQTIQHCLGFAKIVYHPHIFSSFHWAICVTSNSSVFLSSSLHNPSQVKLQYWILFWKLYLLLIFLIENILSGMFNCQCLVFVYYISTAWLFVIFRHYMPVNQPCVFNGQYKGYSVLPPTAYCCCGRFSSIW